VFVQARSPVVTASSGVVCLMVRARFSVLTASFLLSVENKRLST
jgi:hypothetical protein